MKRRASCLGVTGFVSWPVHQPLAGDAPKGHVGSLRVVHAELDAGTIYLTERLMADKQSKRDRPAREALDLDSDQDIDAMLERGAVVLRDSGRLWHEDAESDRALVLAILDAVFRSSDDGAQATERSV